MHVPLTVRACGAAAPCQNFATSLLNLPCLPVGSISIGSIYAALAISALVAPAVIRKVGERMAMIVTSMAYWSYVLSVSYIITPVVLLTSINIGLCGGVSSLRVFPCLPTIASGTAVLRPARILLIMKDVVRTGSQHGLRVVSGKEL